MEQAVAREKPSRRLVAVQAIQIISRYCAYELMGNLLQRRLVDPTSCLEYPDAHRHPGGVFSLLG
jgi:hypothetical protein